MTQSTTSPQCFVFSNHDIVTILEQVADLLEIQEAGYYRIRAYREAAQMIRSLDRPIVEILQTEGIQGLEALPHIGRRLARSLNELIHTGELHLLNQLLEDIPPEGRFTTIPGIGEVLAHRVRGTRTGSPCWQARYHKRIWKRSYSTDS